MRAFDQFVADGLESLERGGLLRQSESPLRERVLGAAARLGRPAIDASSNDYLGLALVDVSRETDVQSRGPSGAGASRLIHGTRPEHLALEAETAGWVGLDAALLFSTGYSANLGLLQALAGPDVAFVSDALNHASIIDGCRLGRGCVEVVPHLCVGEVERCLLSHRQAAARCVVTESYFSMDGDGPDLRALRAVCDRNDAALIVDEAHALGVFGPEGSGRCREAGVVPDALVGTLGKAVGVQGAFVASSTSLRELLWNRARSFVFSTAPSPLLAGLALFHVQRTRSADGLRVLLRRRAEQLRAALAQHGLSTTPGSFGPIVPVLIGDEARTLAAAERLADNGILAQAIRPPTVPAGTARLRLTAKASWDEDSPAIVARVLAEVLAP